jgi:hypothetical protein
VPHAPAVGITVLARFAGSHYYICGKKYATTAVKETYDMHKGEPMDVIYIGDDHVISDQCVLMR